MHLENLQFQLNIAGINTSGLISGNQELWDFKSDDLEFLHLCPAGALYSFSMYGEGDALIHYKIFHKSICQKIDEELNPIAQYTRGSCTSLCNELYSLGNSEEIIHNIQ